MARDLAAEIAEHIDTAEYRSGAEIVRAVNARWPGISRVQFDRACEIVKEINAGRIAEAEVERAAIRLRLGEIKG